jgi:hypothetical protein
MSQENERLFAVWAAMDYIVAVFHRNWGEIEKTILANRFFAKVRSIRKSWMS